MTEFSFLGELAFKITIVFDLCLGRGDNDKMKQLEDKIQKLTKDLTDLQSTLRGMNEEMHKPGFNGGKHQLMQPSLK